MDGRDEPGHDGGEDDIRFSTLHLFSLPRHYLLIRRLKALADARPRFPAPLHAQNGPPSDSNNHGFSADVPVWRGFVRRLMGSRFGGDIPWTGGPAGFMLGIGAKGDEAT